MPVEQLIHRRTTGSFQGNRDVRRISFHLIPELVPALSGVRETELGCDGSALINHTDVVMITRPVQCGKVRYFIPMSIHIACGTHSAGLTRHRRTDTGALWGRSSLSLLRVGRRRRRRSADDPRRACPKGPCRLRSRKRAGTSLRAGKVFRHLRLRAFSRALAPMANNFGNRISPKMNPEPAFKTVGIPWG